MADPTQTILDLLESNWNSTNTSGITPTFIKVIDKKRITFNKIQTQAFVILQRPRKLNEPAGISDKGKHTTVTMDIDIRVSSKQSVQSYLNDEVIFIEIQDEVSRILDSNIKLLDGNYDILNPDGQEIDLSNETRHLWRNVVTVQLIKYNIQRGA